MSIHPLRRWKSFQETRQRAQILKANTASNTAAFDASLFALPSNTSPAPKQLAKRMRANNSFPIEPPKECFGYDCECEDECESFLSTKMGSGSKVTGMCTPHTYWSNAKCRCWIIGVLQRNWGYSRNEARIISERFPGCGEGMLGMTEAEWQAVAGVVIGVEIYQVVRRGEEEKKCFWGTREGLCLDGKTEGERCRKPVGLFSRRTL